MSISGDMNHIECHDVCRFVPVRFSHRTIIRSYRNRSDHVHPDPVPKAERMMFSSALQHTKCHESYSVSVSILMFHYPGLCSLNLEPDFSLWSAPTVTLQTIPRGGGGSGPSSIPLSGKLDGRENVKMTPRPFEDIPEDVRRILAIRSNPDAKKTSVIDVLMEKHVLSAIIYIDRMSPVMKSDVYSDISRSSGMSGKIVSLYRLGIIEIFGTVSGAEILVITEKGRRIAALIREIVDIVEGRGSGEEVSEEDIGRRDHRSPSPVILFSLDLYHQSVLTELVHLLCHRPCQMPFPRVLFDLLNIPSYLGPSDHIFHR